jgi:hypothetical protein
MHYGKHSSVAGRDEGKVYAGRGGRWRLRAGRSGSLLRSPLVAAERIVVVWPPPSAGYCADNAGRGDSVDAWVRPSC